MAVLWAAMDSLPSWELYTAEAECLTPPSVRD